MTDEEIKKLQDEVTYLRGEVNRLKDEFIRLVSRNLASSCQGLSVVQLTKAGTAKPSP
jgi:hypothetical protein